jgi:hypothetical protein
MTRFSAFAIHLGISLAIFAVLAYLVVAVWYPDLFFTTDGGWQGMRIIIAVDLVLGPLLTLIVYKHGKPGLKFDLACIGTFQAICLIAGTWLVHSERPLAIIYADGQFTSLSRDSYQQANMEIPDFDQFPGDYPKWIMIDVPDDIIEQADLRREMMSKGRILELAVDNYLPFDPNSTRFQEEAVDADDLLEGDQVAQQVPSWLARHGGSLEDYRFYPYGTRYKYLYLGYRDDPSELIGLLGTPMPN